MSSVATSSASSAIHILETGIVYRNPKPHLRTVHAMHPTLALLATGEIVAAYDLGQAAQSLDYATYCSRSVDGGKTWTNPQRLIEPDSSQGLRTTIVRIRQVASGEIVGLGCHVHRPDPDEGYINPANFGHTPTDLFLIRSTDGGHTWTRPEIFEPPIVGPAFEICHPIVELADGRWLAPMATWKGWDGDAPNGMKSIALVSHDQGRTWPEYINELDDWANGYMHVEQTFVK